MRPSRALPNPPTEGELIGSIDADDTDPTPQRRQYRYRGPELDALLDQVRRELGDDADIVKTDRNRTGGLAGFFARESFEVVASRRRKTTSPTANNTLSAGLLARAEAISAQEQARRDPEAAALRSGVEASALDTEISNQREAAESRPFDEVLDVELRRVDERQPDPPTRSARPPR